MDINELSAHPTLKLTKNNIVIVDEEGVQLLILIDNMGSILAASKELNISYSRAWELISRIERVLGVRVIESRRGGRRGGGTKLTEEGRKLITKYLHEYKKYFGKKLGIKETAITLKRNVLTYAGSNDMVLENIFGIMRKEEIPIEIYWIGSLRGLASIVLDECDLAGIHLLDFETGEYNISYIKKYGITEDIILVRGYEREIGFITREEISYKDIVKGIMDGDLKIVNRNRGSGTRLIIDYIIKNEAEREGVVMDEIVMKIKGYEDIVYTHIDAAKKIALGEADVGVGLKKASNFYKLKFTHITRENFDFILRKNKLEDENIKKFIDILKSEKITDILNEYEGYRDSNARGEIIL